MKPESLNKAGNVFYVICRISIGLFFFITGLNKLFHPVFQGYMLNTMIKIGFSDPQLMAHFVAFNEALWGLLLLLGLLTRLSSFSLIIIMVVALTTKDIHSIPTELVPMDSKVGVRPMDNFTWLTYFFLSSTGLIYYVVRYVFLFTDIKFFGLDYFLKKEKKHILHGKRICCYFIKSKVSV